MKPKTEWCRLSALKRWKGWSEQVIRKLVSSGKLMTKRFPPARHNSKARRKQKLGRRYYHVPTAEPL